MADPLAAGFYAGWPAAEIEADLALTLSTHALGQADGLLNPALDPIFARAVAAKTAIRVPPPPYSTEDGDQDVEGDAT